MKRFLSFLLICISFLVMTAQPKNNSYVEVLYFHGKQRCVTCIAIEKYTKKVISSDFAKLVKSGKVRYKEVDISTPAGEKLADKYHVSWSSLYVNGWKNGKEKRTDLTRYAFENARTNTPAFKQELKKTINANLK